MVRFEHDGMSLWYGTADAPAPLENISGGEEVIISVGVTPVDASNAVEVYYRINQGPVQTVAAKWYRNEPASKTQYFRAYLPPLRAGDVVEYTAVCRCAGRQVPAPEQAKCLESSFRVVDEAAASARGQRPRLASQPGLSEARATPEVRARAVAPAATAASLALRSPGAGRTPAPDATASHARQLPRVTMPRVERPTPESRVPTAPVLALPNPTLNELARVIKLERGQEVLSALSKHSLKTLEDVRKAGGISQLEGLSVSPAHPAVKTLEAHAHLSVLSSDLHVNAKLIDKGFTSIASIASLPSELFVATMRDDVDEQKALQLSYQSQKQKAILDNIMIEQRTNIANGRVRFDTAEGAEPPPPATCRCRDCEAAVSPLAYLADLLAYVALKWRVWHGNQRVTLDWLQAHFHQPFANLPAACEAVDERVRQVRICVEVLRRYLQANQVPFPEPHEGRYLREAYLQLLTRLGISYEELRLARDPTPAPDSTLVTDLANRLGIAQGHLNELFFDLAAALPSLNEEILETRFGLIATRHADDMLPDPLRSPRPSDVQRWRLEYLRAQWQAQDHPEDPYTGGALPIIDPDLIGPDDFRLHTGTGQRALNLWITRHQEVDRELERLSNLSFDGMIADAFPGHDLAQIHSRLMDSAADMRQAAIHTIEQDLKLTVESFTRLMTLREQDRLAGLRSGIEPLTAEDWQEVRSICVQSIKVSRWYGQWKHEEKPVNRPAEHIQLHPDTFWLSLSEPTEGMWPPLNLSASDAMIDPDIVALGDLPDTPFGAAVRDLWQERQRWLENEPMYLRRQHLETLARGNDGYQEILLSTFGSSFVGEMDNLLNTVDGGLAADDPNLVQAKAALAAQYLTEEAFRTLGDVKYRNAADYQTVSETDWQEVYYILSRVRRKKFEPWKAVEETRNLHYWRAFKAKLPRWRASPEARQQWQQALRTRSSAPIIDPDLLLDNTINGRGDFRVPTGGNEAYQLYMTRRNWLNNTALPALRTTRSGPGNDLPWLHTRLMERTGLGLEGLRHLKTERDEGIDITRRLEQLNLTNAAFTFLLRLQNLLDANQDVLASEWEEVDSILVQIDKQLKFGAWRDEESKAGITLSPDFFRIPDPPPIQMPPPEPLTLPKWRVTRSARRDWEDTLQARLDQEQSVIDALREMVSETEEAVLPMLRDILINASNQPSTGTRLEAKAQWLTDHLLIDTQTNGCQMTTRISQAIETMQGLLWSIRTGQLKDTYPDLKLFNPAAFDEEWKWLGSYAKWRSAMFVFLYPENILYPTLRRWESEGFSELVQKLRLNQRLNPKTAQELAGHYAEYYDDVTHLEVEVSCQAGTRTYWYGWAPSGRCYWSRYDNDNDNPNYAQTSWRKIGRFSDKNRTEQLLGAVPFGGVSAEQPDAILVFAKQKKGAGYQLVVARHNLSDETWEAEEDEPEPLALPDGVMHFSAVVNQIRTVSQPPSLVIQDEETGKIYYERYLNAEGSDWDDGGWRAPAIFFSGAAGGKIKLRAMIPASRTQPEAGSYFFFEEVGYAGTPHARLGIGIWTPQPSEASWFIDDSHQGPARWLGAFLWPDDDTIYAVAQANGNPFLVEVNPVTGDTLPHAPPLSSEWWAYGLQSTDRLTIDSGLPSPIETNLPNSHPRIQLTLAERRQSYSHWVTGILVSQSGALHIANPWAPYDLRDWHIVPTDTQPLKIAPAESNASQNVLRAYTYSFFDIQDARHGLNPWVRMPTAIFAYTEERYFFVPLLLALELQRRGYYTEALDWYRAVYDYTEPDEKDSSGRSLRKIWYGLEFEEQPDHTTYERQDDWLQDPLNPHHIASTRPNTYTRFTLQSLVRCFLEYGDAEFTRDTAESVPRARTLYTTALELLDTNALKQRLNDCEAKVAEIIITIGEAATQVTGVELEFDPKTFIEELEMLLDPRRADPMLVEEISSLIQPVPGNGRPPEEAAGMLTRVREIVEAAQVHPAVAKTFGTVVGTMQVQAEQAHAGLLANATIADAVSRVGRTIYADDTYSNASPGRNDGRIGGMGLAGRASDTRGNLGPTTGNSTNAQTFAITSSDSLSRMGPSGSTNSPGSIFLSAIPRGGGGWRPNITTETIPAPAFDFCIPPNPILRALHLHAALNLYKLRNCRNIAGMERALDPYAAATDTVSGLPMIGVGGQLVLPGAASLRPTPYRYPFLIERAKHLVQLAQQIESAMLSAIERRDNEYYNLLKARQELRLARAGVRLQRLRVTEAEHGVALAELQRRRAEIQVEEYTRWIEEGISTLESVAIGFLIAAGVAQVAAQGLYGAAAGFGSLEGAARASEALASAFSTTATILSTYASYERREQEWKLQKSLAEQDVLIGDQQIRLAEDHVRVVEQEHRIAEMQADQAEVVVDYLSNKFTNVNLYDWMSGVLEGVYSFFLQQATTVAKLAETQLAFERQEVPPQYMQDDYWEAPADFAASGGTQGNPPDRRGLTGSARLLRDIYQLDQYAFDTDRRKLQLTKTISLASLAPIEFQQFRETGVLSFRTPMDLFDRDFPGHYLRLMKRVLVSVIALIPPTQGIRATLTTSGTSRVVIGGYVFQKVVRNYGPQSVALSAPQNATGVFELQQAPEKLLPFEGLGVDTDWEFRMPKASNQFDYRSIADVLLTIEYSALDSYDYRQQVLQDLDSRFSADRPFSFRHQFADQWWDLHNPEQSAMPMTVRFETRREDFPPNLQGLRIQHVVLYFARSAHASPDTPEDLRIPVTHLHFTEQGTTGAVGGGATSIEGLISTRRGNAGSWASMMGKSPIGVWELTLPNAADMQDLFKHEEIEDILLVITYAGRTPEWPA
jgi:hypothetical protein